MKAVMLLSVGSIFGIVLVFFFTIISMIVKSGAKRQTDQMLNINVHEPDIPKSQEENATGKGKEGLEYNLRHSENKPVEHQKAKEVVTETNEVENDEKKMTVDDMKKAVIMSEILNRKY